MATLLPGRTRPTVVELAGPAGSGKSSLLRELVGAGAPGYVAGGLRGHTRRSDLPWAAARVAPPFLAQAPWMPSRPLYRLKLMVQLGCHERWLRRWPPGGGTVVMDQGPLYLLSILQRALRGDGRDRAAFVRYWEDTTTRWARAIDLVVVVDAPDAVLLERVRRRGTPHPLLGRSPEDAARSVHEGRRSRDSILALLRDRNPALSVLDLGARQEPVESLAERVRERVRELASPAAGQAPGTAGGASVPVSTEE